MVFQYLCAIAAIISYFQTNGSIVDSGSGPLDCVRIRSASISTLVYGTGYLYQGKKRYMGVYDHYSVPHNSAYRIERIPEFTEPLYNIRMINTREYVYGGDISTATHVNRVPVFTNAYQKNKTYPDSSVWLFEKAHHDNKWLGGWFIKNVYYNNYMVASSSDSQPPSEAADASFHALKLDRTYQPRVRDDLMFFFEEC